MKRLPKYTAHTLFSLGCGMGFFLLFALLEVLLHDQLRILPDDGLCFFTWPIGVWIGWRTCGRHYHLRGFQTGTLTTGLFFLGLFSWSSWSLYLRSKALTGMGPFAGLGEILLSYVCGFVALAFLFFALSGLILRLAEKEQAAPRAQCPI